MLGIQARVITPDCESGNRKHEGGLDTGSSVQPRGEDMVDSRGRGTVKGRVAESQALKLTLQAVGERRDAT